VHVVEVKDERDVKEISIIENLQREDLNPLEETEALLDLIGLELNSERKEVISLFHRAVNAKKRNVDLDNETKQKIDHIGKTLLRSGGFTIDSFRVSRLPLLKVPEDIQEAIMNGSLEYTKGLFLARIINENERRVFLEKTLSEGLSISQLKVEVRKFKELNSTVEGKKQFQKGEKLTVKAQLSSVRKLIDTVVGEDKERRDKAFSIIEELEKLMEGR
jgi:ParB family transcriptional regulator, chromosome partitioning protein